MSERDESRTHDLFPRPNQVQALTDLVKAFALGDRAQLVMACGTGKTLVGAWHAQASEARTVALFVPSLALVAQTIREWKRSGYRFRHIIVCSDPTTAAGSAERTDGTLPREATLNARVTTRPENVCRFLNTKSVRPTVVFSTYHSAPVVAEAVRASRTPLDLVIADEAHHLAGNPRDDFRVVLDAKVLPAARRLFMTATQRTSGEISMDDPTIFGPVAHRVRFSDAISAGMLCDYRVVIHGERGGDDTADDTATSALLAAVRQFGISRVLAFHGRIAGAASFASALHGTEVAGRAVSARHVSGGTTQAARQQHLDWLAGATQTPQVRVLSSARILTEGVDVPAVDGIVFVDPRGSFVDIVQAVGRVMRPAPGKTIGTIVLPVTLPGRLDEDSELLGTRFAGVWSVLRALRAHDERFSRIPKTRTNEHKAFDQKKQQRSPRIVYNLPNDIDRAIVEDLVESRIVEGWERHLLALTAWVRANPDKRISYSAVHDGLLVGSWAVTQRHLYRRGQMSAERIELVEQVPGWFWELADAAWDDTYAYLVRLGAQWGTVADDEPGPSRYAKLYTRGHPREYLGVWVARQRVAYRNGELDAERVALLAALPGWAWTVGEGDDAAMVAALASFVEIEGHADVPPGHIEDDLRLGSWVWSVRRRKVRDRLSSALEDEILAVTPSPWATGNRVRWQWDTAEAKWRFAYAGLLAYVERTGTAMVAPNTTEVLADGEVRLSQFVGLQRHEHAKGELSDLRISLLERLPGWGWSSTNRTRPAGEPIELPDNLSHGTAGAFARGCTCPDCLEYNRGNQRRAKQKKRLESLRCPVAPTKARRHVTQLQASLATKINTDLSAGRAASFSALIAFTAQVPVGLIRQLTAGSETKIEREHEARLLATKVPACLRNVSMTGSRGRAVLDPRKNQVG